MLLITVVAILAIVGWYLFKDSNEPEVRLPGAEVPVPPPTQTCVGLNSPCDSAGVWASPCCEGYVCDDGAGLDGNLGVCVEVKQSTSTEITSTTIVPIEPTIEVTKTTRDRKKKNT